MDLEALDFVCTIDYFSYYLYGSLHGPQATDAAADIRPPESPFEEDVSQVTALAGYDGESAWN